MTCLADFEKVVVCNGKIHLMYRRSNYTLCGLEWHHHNTRRETYCRKCQRALAKAMKAERGHITMSPQPPARNQRNGRHYNGGKRNDK